MRNSAVAVLARRCGRRAGKSETRGLVLSVARRQFARMGYDRTTLRSIAAEAGVDQKLVAYFYGSKHSLFVAASELPFKGGAAIEETLSRPPEKRGMRLARLVLACSTTPTWAAGW